jgi:general secretion pathway protein E
MSNLNIAENRLPQDGRIKIKVMGKDIDIRVSTIPCQFGERIVMRLLNKTDMNYSLENLGLSGDIEKQMKAILSIPNGIFLVTGPTGSGKSTTLYSGLTFLNSPECNIITVEDPVEYQVPGIAQMQMKSTIGLTFATGLRAILRQDPDIIMVGEIRDTETANVAAQAALTGHMVFSTLHTNDAATAVTRLVDMKIEPFLITSTVRAVLAQRLVRRLCTCKKPKKITSVEAKNYKVSPKSAVYFPVGCEKCMNTGYRGRIGIYELLVTGFDINQLILQGADSNNIYNQALQDGMIPMRQDGINKVMSGITTFEEVNRVT